MGRRWANLVQLPQPDRNPDARREGGGSPIPAIVMSNQNSVICSIADWRTRNCEPVVGLGPEPINVASSRPMIAVAAACQRALAIPETSAETADARRCVEAHWKRETRTPRTSFPPQSANLRLRAHYIRDRAYVIDGGVGSVIRFGDRLSLHLVKD